MTPTRDSHLPRADAGPNDWLVGAAVGVCLALVLFAHGGIWDHVGGRDLHAHFLPRFEAAGLALRELRLPLWNPYELFGAPLLGSGQGAMLYPPVAVLFAFLPAYAALQALYAFHVALFAAASFVYARRQGISRLGAGLAPIVGLAGLFTSLGLNGIDHPSFLCSLTWLPVLLLCRDNAARRDPARWAACLALAYAAQWLAGYPDFPLDTAVLLLVVALLDEPGSRLRGTAWLLVGLGLGATLAAPYILAVHDAAVESVRSEYQHLLADFRSKAFAIRSPSDLARSPIKPSFLPALALASLASLRLDRARLAWGVALLWCIFPLNFPFSLLYELPGFETSRAPLGWGAMGGTFLGLLAGAGLDEGRRHATLRIAAGGVATAMAAYGVWLIAGAPALMRNPAPDYDSIARRAAILRSAVASRDPAPRLVDAATTDAGGLLRYRLRSPTGYEPSVPPRRAVHLLKLLELHESPGWGTWEGVARKPELAALAGIGLVAARPSGAGALEAAGFERLATLPSGDVLLFREPIPRARLVHRVVTSASEAESLARIAERSAGDAATAVVEDPSLAGSLAEPRPGAKESVRIALDEPERVALEVLSASPGLVVLTDAFAPGWEATLDGEPVAILRADYAFRGVLVPAGTHRIELAYRPRAARLGVWLAGTGFLATCGLFLGGVSRRPRAGETRRDARNG